LDIVHRDVSPQNVLLSYEGAVKITDFGIAKAKLITEETGLIKGKFSYMSPEQARGLAVDRRSDIYSLGVVLHELLTGRPLYAGRAGLDVLELVRRGDVPTPRTIDPSIPADLERIVMRAVAFDRDARYETAREMASELTRWLHAQDEISDAGSVEQVVQDLAPRERTSPEVKAAPVGTRAAQPAHDEPTLAAEKGRERTLRER
ncbi:MAG: serine/threonine protein kinase, partial [Planctomycetes bacterium]|nr:serine/threonine protein kinase [Planctomycetota bacterium]